MNATFTRIKQYSIVIILLTCSVAIFYSGCKSEDPAPAASCSDGIQNQGETGVDCGGPCAFCETCFDGIQNQDETGVDCGGVCPACPSCFDGINNQGETGFDCGGPCPPCPFVCTGNGGTNYFPLATNNKWTYNSNAVDYTWTVTGTTTINSQTYTIVKGESTSGSYQEYYRVDNGDVYKYDTISGQEFLDLPANLVVGQPWIAPGGNTKKVISTNASITTDICIYTGCLQVQLNTSIGTIAATYYYKQGIGIVRSFFASSGNIDDLSELVLN